MTGVSTDISTSFIRAAGTEGDTLYCKGIVEGMGEYFDLPDVRGNHQRLAGKSLAYTRIEFKNHEGQLVAFGRESISCMRQFYHVLPGS
jgi:acyl-coenzyme A thioesterase 13